MLNSLAASFRTSWAATAMPCCACSLPATAEGQCADSPARVREDRARSGDPRRQSIHQLSHGRLGPITYSSSNPAVAIAGANTGTVTITGAGSATMTANAAASSQQAS